MTRRALLLAAALAWPGVAWGQSGTICVRDGVTWNSLGGRCDEERAAGMGAPSGGAAGCPAPSIPLNGQCVVVIGSAAGCYSSTPTKDKLKAMQQPSGLTGMGFGTTSCRAGRSYTVAEIDRMREAVRKKLTVMAPFSPCTPKAGNAGCGCVPKEICDGPPLPIPPSEEAVKDYLLVYIAAGIGPDELEKQ